MPVLDEAVLPRNLFREIIRRIDDLRRRPVPAKAEELDGEVKSTGEVRLDDDNIAQMGFRTRPNHQIGTVVWPQREIPSNGGAFCLGVVPI